MKKILCVCFLFSFLQLRAQQKSYIAISVGTAVPLDVYANSSVNTSLINSNARLSSFLNEVLLKPSGSANTGFGLSLEGTKYLSSNIGFSAQFSYLNNSFDNKPLEQVLSDPGGGFSSQYMVSHYSHLTLMAGPTVGITQQNISLDFGLRAGIAYSNFPINNLTLYAPFPVQDQNGNITGSTNEPLTEYKYTSSHAMAFAYGLSAMFRYDVNDHLGLFLKPEVTWFKQSFSATLTQTNYFGGPQAGSYSTSLQTKIEIPVNIFYIGIGVAYKL